jgi:putative ABC transport system permease protein
VNFKESLAVALTGLLANKMRSFLTMLGVIIGVAAVIIVVAIGQGMKQETLQRIQGMGTNLLTISPGPARTGAVSTDITVINLELTDAEEIKSSVRNILDLAPEVGRMVQAKYRNMNYRTRIVGTTVEYQTVRNWKIAQGRFFDASELRGRQRVCVLGPEVVEELFGRASPLGEWVRVNGIPFEVIGVAEEVGGGGFGRSPDNQIVAPLSTVAQRVMGRSHLDSITVSATSADAVDRVEKGIEVLLRRRHKLRPGQPNDFRIMKQSQMLSSMSEAGETLTRLLTGIALVSLLVGGVGIMNIMLVSVTERTREIGIRKAVGARKSDVLAQFLIESVVLSVIGGAIGIGLGVGVAKLLGRQGDWTTIISPASIIYAFAFAAVVGVFFGLWPAKKAADMDPIEALRYE